MSHTDPTLTSDAIVHTTAEMDLAISHWFLAATESRDRSRMEWQEQGVTMLRTGGIFSAIRMTARLVHAAAATGETSAVDNYLHRALVSGPVIADLDRCRYYALVPSSAARRWSATRDAEPFGRDAYVGVPRPGLNTAPASGGSPYWAVPMESAGVLCVPAAVAALVEVGRYELAQAAATDGPNLPLQRERRR